MEKKMQVKMENILWQYAKYCHKKYTAEVDPEAGIGVIAISALQALESQGYAVRIEDGDVTWRATPAFLPGRERGPLVTFGPNMQEIVLFN
jgi:hypothetical protein